MLEQILQMPEFVSYLLAAEVGILCVLQFRTNCLIRKGRKLVMAQKEKRTRLKEEMKSGESSIPVVKFEKEKPEESKEPKKGLKPSEMEVLQELLTEYFG